MEPGPVHQPAERIELGLRVRYAGEAEQVQRGVAARAHHGAQTRPDLGEAVAAGLVVRVVQGRTRGAQAGPQRVEAGRAELADGVGPARVAVQVDGAGRGLRADPAHRVGQHGCEQERLALAALAEAHHAVRDACEVRERHRGQLGAGRGLGETVMARAERAVRLERDATDALRIASAARRKRCLVPAEKEVLRRPAAVGQRAALELACDAVPRQLGAPRRDPLPDARLGEAPGILARVGIGAERARPVAAVGEADRRVGEGGQHGGALAPHPGGVVARGVRRRQEGGDRARLAAEPGVDDHALPAREPHRRAPGQCEQVAAARQWNPVARADRLGPGAALACEAQLRVVVDAIARVGHEQTHRLAGRVAGLRSRVRHALLRARVACPASTQCYRNRENVPFRTE